MRQPVATTQDITLELGLYKGMVELREFELKVQELYRDGKLPGFVHLYIGEEAVATGVCAHLKPNDLVYSTHRGHGHALAKGVTAREVMAELYGKATGCSGGRGGSMSVAGFRLLRVRLSARSFGKADRL
jgi:TPP-dependent pyruvate/acetoin dehydrogenase alpha subunit